MGLEVGIGVVAAGFITGNAGSGLTYVDSLV